jgi:hypothetical protein
MKRTISQSEARDKREIYLQCRNQAAHVWNNSDNLCENGGKNEKLKSGTYWRGWVRFGKPLKLMQRPPLNEQRIRSRENGMIIAVIRA